MNIVQFEGWKNCVEMVSGDFKLIVTTDIGPRVIGGFVGGGQNIFCVVPRTAGKKGGNAWNLYGGHRLWHSPESKPRTYHRDNGKVKVKELSEGGVLFAPRVDEVGIQKSLAIFPLGKNQFRIEHRLVNKNAWPVELAAWALSVMAAGGTAVVPQPQGDPKELLPNRYLTIWPYTNMADPRLTWGDKFTLLRQSSKVAGKCKFGLNAEDGWLAYIAKDGSAFVKSFEHYVDAEYPDNGCSVECFTNRFMLEVETLSPLYLLDEGDEIVHVETWTGVEGVGPVKTVADAEAVFGSCDCEDCAHDDDDDEFGEAPERKPAKKPAKGKSKKV